MSEERIRAPFDEIRVIVGANTMAVSSKKARKMYLCMVQSIQIFKRPPKAAKVDNPTINFTEKDARRLHHPHDDAVVVSLSIANFNTRQVLVDNGSSAGILYYPTFQQMRVNQKRLLPSDTPLVGFGGTKVFLVGTITLPITIWMYPQ